MMSDEDLASISENCSAVWKAVARELIAARAEVERLRGLFGKRGEGCIVCGHSPNDHYPDAVDFYCCISECKCDQSNVKLAWELRAREAESALSAERTARVEAEREIQKNNEQIQFACQRVTKAEAARVRMQEALEDLLGWQSLAPEGVVARASAALAAEPGEVAATPEANQCDGCRLGLRFSDDGRYHIYENGSIYMACSRERYEGHPRAAEGAGWPGKTS